MVSSVVDVAAVSLYVSSPNIMFVSLWYFCYWVFLCFVPTAACTSLALNVHPLKIKPDLRLTDQRGKQSKKILGNLKIALLDLEILEKKYTMLTIFIMTSCGNSGTLICLCEITIMFQGKSMFCAELLTISAAPSLNVRLSNSSLFIGSTSYSTSFRQPVAFSGV